MAIIPKFETAKADESGNDIATNKNVIAVLKPTLKVC